MDFGKNICVGDVGHSYLNAFRQLLIGCEEAKTEYIVTAEADCFYPPTGYFDFEPTDPNAIYSYDNTWIIWKNGNEKFYYKKQTHAGMIYGREFLIKFLNECFKGLPQWSRERLGFPFYKPDQKFVGFAGLPVINVKTGDSMNKWTRLTGEFPPTRELEYWGTARDFKKRIFYE
jgi:hypothetical protein